MINDYINDIDWNSNKLYNIEFLNIYKNKDSN